MPIVAMSIFAKDLVGRAVTLKTKDRILIGPLKEDGTFFIQTDIGPGAFVVNGSAELEYAPGKRLKIGPT
jgi:hypothetical protein